MQEKLTRAQIELIQLRNRVKHKYGNIVKQWQEAIKKSEDGYVLVTTKWGYDGVESKSVTSKTTALDILLKLMEEISVYESGKERVNDEPFWANIDHIDVLDFQGSPRTLDMLTVDVSPMPKSSIPKSKLSKIKLDSTVYFDFEACLVMVAAAHAIDMKPHTVSVQATSV